MGQGVADVSADHLKQIIQESLQAQGYELNCRSLFLNGEDKEVLRHTHALAVQTEIRRAEPALRPYEDRLLAYLANGDEVSPECIRPRLVPVKPETDYSRLFRYASLHWSIPISNGYGRRLRFLLFDESNGKLMGILGLSDPVFSLRARDDWVGCGTLSSAGSGSFTSWKPTCSARCCLTRGCYAESL